MMCEIDGLFPCMPLVGSELSALRTPRGCFAFRLRGKPRSLYGGSSREETPVTYPADFLGIWAFFEHKTTTVSLR